MVSGGNHTSHLLSNPIDLSIIKIGAQPNSCGCYYLAQTNSVNWQFNSTLQMFRLIIMDLAFNPSLIVIRPAFIIYFSIGASTCSLIDKIFWHGSLDFLVFMGFIHDLKDCYSYLAEILILLDLYRNWSKINSFSLKSIWDNYYHYLHQLVPTKKGQGSLQLSQFSRLLELTLAFLLPLSSGSLAMQPPLPDNAKTSLALEHKRCLRCCFCYILTGDQQLNFKGESI